MPGSEQYVSFPLMTVSEAAKILGVGAGCLSALSSGRDSRGRMSGTATDEKIARRIQGERENELIRRCVGVCGSSPPARIRGVVEDRSWTGPASPGSPGGVNPIGR